MPVFPSVSFLVFCSFSVRWEDNHLLLQCKAVVSDNDVHDVKFRSKCWLFALFDILSHKMQMQNTDSTFSPEISVSGF